MMAYSVNHAEPEGMAEVNKHRVVWDKINCFGKIICCFFPAEHGAEKQDWSNGIEKSLRAELLEGIGQADEVIAVFVIIPVITAADVGNGKQI